MSLVFQPPEGARMHYAVPIALEIVAVGMSRLGKASSPAKLDWKTKMSEDRGTMSGQELVLRKAAVGGDSRAAHRSPARAQRIQNLARRRRIGPRQHFG